MNQDNSGWLKTGNPEGRSCSGWQGLWTPGPLLFILIFFHLPSSEHVLEHPLLELAPIAVRHELPVVPRVLPLADVPAGVARRAFAVQVARAPVVLHDGQLDGLAARDAGGAPGLLLAVRFGAAKAPRATRALRAGMRSFVRSSSIVHQLDWIESVKPVSTSVVVLSVEDESNERAFFSQKMAA